MVDTRIVIAGLWVATMLTYLWGDVMRIFAGDVEPGKLTGGGEATPAMWLFIAAIMLVPAVCVILVLEPALRSGTLAGSGR